MCPGVVVCLLPRGGLSCGHGMLCFGVLYNSMDVSCCILGSTFAGVSPGCVDTLICAHGSMVAGGN